MKIEIDFNDERQLYALFNTLETILVLHNNLKTDDEMIYNLINKNCVTNQEYKSLTQRQDYKKLELNHTLISLNNLIDILKKDDFNYNEIVKNIRLRFIKKYGDKK